MPGQVFIDHPTGDTGILIKTRNGDEVVKIDGQDIPKVEPFHWGIYKDAKGRKLARAGKKDGQVMLHKHLFEIPKGSRLVWKNGNTLDLRRENLQLVEKDGKVEPLKKEYTNEFEGKSEKKRSKVRGVYFHKHAKKWHAAAFHDKRRYSLGYFDTEDEAVEQVTIFRSEGPDSKNLKRNQKGGN
jgi:hypothetical protein